MNINIIKKLSIVAAVTSVLFLTACYQPSPLTGTWADNPGNQVTLFADYSYSAKILSSVGDITTYNGMYNVIDNVICFTSDEGYVVVTEWDLRGSELKLLWTDKSGEPLQLTLYRQKR